MIRLVLFLPLALLFSCKISQNAAWRNSPFVELRTGGCFGFCPIIRLTVRNNGLVEYEGGMFAERTGLDSFQLEKEELRQLRVKVEQVNLWQYPDRIETDIMDAPSSTLTVFRDGRSKSVQGSADRPAPLVELENLIKNLAEAHEFQVKQGVNPRVPPPDSRAEVLVRLKPEVNAGNWLMQFTEFKFVLTGRVSEENIWKVAYDPKQIKEPAVIGLFKEHTDVLDVQSNMPVQDRH
ncbi:MAG: hypothetical protein EP344_03790 [Bacteroidetes bacterium]|nr:MAG: hypothetical protein EP344_03790 [Bacteroidota bacterium]